jgi:hypothetical protein
MVTLDGTPLYPKRISDTFSYDLNTGQFSEQQLYDDVTGYIRSYYNKAKLFNRSAARFAMGVFQPSPTRSFSPSIAAMSFSS